VRVLAGGVSLLLLFSDEAGEHPAKANVATTARAPMRSRFLVFTVIGGAPFAKIVPAAVQTARSDSFCKRLHDEPSLRLAGNKTA
jgi:hypothetical protein